MGATSQFSVSVAVPRPGTHIQACEGQGAGPRKPEVEVRRRAPSQERGAEIGERASSAETVLDLQPLLEKAWCGYRVLLPGYRTLRRTPALRRVSRTGVHFAPEPSIAADTQQDCLFLPPKTAYLFLVRNQIWINYFYFKLFLIIVLYLEINV